MDGVTGSSEIVESGVPATTESGSSDAEAMAPMTSLDDLSNMVLGGLSQIWDWGILDSIHNSFHKSWCRLERMELAALSHFHRKRYIRMCRVNWLFRRFFKQGQHSYYIYNFIVLLPVPFSFGQ